MPALGEVDETKRYSETSNGATEEAERLRQAAGGNVTPPVEGAHSEGGRSVRTESDEGSRGGSRTLPPLLGDFDVLRFKNTILEVVEELRMRRIIDAENEERIKSLITEKQDLEQKLEEEHSNHEAVIEGHTHSEQELKRSYEEQLKQAEEEVTRSKLSAESKEQEARALKDEIRSLHLTRYNLEKKVQEQERQLHLQGSSKENYLSQVNQLEQNCLSVSRQASEVTEQMEKLEANVREASELHKKLEYVNEHQKCELRESHQQLEQCRRELLEARVIISAERERAEKDGESCFKMKSNSRELRMQVELNHQLQEQLSALREEHQSILQQLKEAYSLVERHIENSAKLSSNEVALEEEVKVLREATEDLQQKLATLAELHESAVDNHSREITESNEKCCELEQRLKVLQTDYAALQASHDHLDEEKLAGERQVHLLKEQLTSLEGELKTAEDELWRLKEDKESLREKTNQLELEVEMCQESVVTAKKSECQNTGTDVVFQPLPSALLPSLSYKALKEEKSTEETNKSTPATLNPSLLNPVFSPEVILISPPLNFTASRKTTPNPDSPPQGDTKVENIVDKGSDDMAVTTSDTAPPSVESNNSAQLSVDIVSSSSTNKRPASHDCDEEGAKLQSPSKRASLDQDERNNSDSDKVTKVADSPVDCEEAVNSGPVGDEGVDHSSNDFDAENVKDEDNKVKQVNMETEAVLCESKVESTCMSESDGAYSLQREEGDEISGLKEVKILSSSSIVGDGAKVGEEGEQGEPEIQVMFSDDDEEGGVSEGHMRMLSSQMNRQIDRVQMFLKLERLRRPKK